MHVMDRVSSIKDPWNLQILTLINNTATLNAEFTRFSYEELVTSRLELLSDNRLELVYTEIFGKVKPQRSLDWRDDVYDKAVAERDLIYKKSLQWSAEFEQRQYPSTNLSRNRYSCPDVENSKSECKMTSLLNCYQFNRQKTFRKPNFLAETDSCNVTSLPSYLGW